MALCIDTTQLAQSFIPEVQNNLDIVAGGVRRFQVHRVCAYATVVRYDSPLKIPGYTHLFGYMSPLAMQGTLDWQPDPDDDLNVLEVFHHLQQQEASAPDISALSSRKPAFTTHVASTISPSFEAMTHGRLLSSFHRYSLRCSKRLIGGFIIVSLRDSVIGNRESAYSRVLPNVVEYPPREIFTPKPGIVWGSDDGAVYSYAILQVQVDLVDLFSRRTHTASRSVKRRRTAVNRFRQVSESAVVEARSPEDQLPHGKRCNGVRYRPDRRTWVAEMKPPKHKNKEDFGNFKLEAQAARAVDAAFHHYGMPHRLNFPDTVQLLSTRPTAAAGLDEKAKLRFVKDEAKWLASTVTFECRSFSEISAPVFSCGGGADEADDGVSHPPLVITTGVETVDSNYVQPEELGAVGTLQEGQDMSVWSLENVIADTDYLANSAHAWPNTWVNSLLCSPPASQFE